MSDRVLGKEGSRCRRLFDALARGADCISYDHLYQFLRLVYGPDLPYSHIEEIIQECSEGSGLTEYKRFKRLLTRVVLVDGGPVHFYKAVTVPTRQLYSWPEWRSFMPKHGTVDRDQEVLKGSFDKSQTPFPAVTESMSGQVLAFADRAHKLDVLSHVVASHVSSTDAYLKPDANKH